MSSEQPPQETPVAADPEIGTTSDTTPEEPSQPATEYKQDNGPLYKKLALVAFVAVVLFGAVSVDQYCRYRAELEPADDKMATFVQGKSKDELTAMERYKLHLIEAEAEQDGQALEPVKVPVKTDHLGQVSASLKNATRSLFTFLGSEEGTFSRVILRRLYDLANVLMVVAFSLVLYHVYVNPQATSDLRPTWSAPLTGLTHLEKIVFGGLSSLAIIQCLSKLYTPAVLTFVPVFLKQAFGRLRSVAISIWDKIGAFFGSLFGDYFTSTSRVNNPVMALILTLKNTWKESLLRKGFRKVVPEGTFRGVYKFLSRKYGHVIYAPLWMGLLLGFHMLFVYNPTALSSAVDWLLPWVVPQAQSPIANSIALWITEGVASVATHQPIYATVATWLFITFGIGGFIRPWGHKKADGSAVAPQDYYRCNRFARVLHLIAGIVCVSLLVMCYLPYAHTLVQTLTGVPLEAAMRSAWPVIRSALWIGLQTAVRTCRVAVDAMMALQWPTTSGFIPFLFTMAWNSLTLFAFYAIPFIVYKFCEHHQVWRWVQSGTTDDEKKAKLKKAQNIALAVYIAFVVLVSAPMLLNILFKFLTFFNYSLPAGFLVTPLYSYIFTLGPILLIPPYLLLMAFQYKWIAPREIYDHEISTVKNRKESDAAFKKRTRDLENGLTISSWLGWPIVKLLAALVLTGLFYTFVHFVYNFDAIVGFFHTLDSIVNLTINVVMWVVGSLTQNMSWVAPFTWTFGVAGLFSILLATMPTFLDSRIGFLLYLPAFHFLGQMLWMMTAVGLNLPVAMLIGFLTLFHLVTAGALLVRNWGATDHFNLMRWVMPWNDEFRGLVADD